MKIKFSPVITRIAQIGSIPGDEDDVKLQKSLLVLSAIPFILVGAGWGIMYCYFGEIKAAIIPSCYSVISCISMVYFGITKKFQIFRFSQLLLILLLPFALMITLGGFIGGSGVILWGLISPLGAMLLGKARQSLLWFAAFLLLLVISGFLEPSLDHSHSLSPEIITLFFVINFTGVGALIFLMVYYFVGKKNLFQARSESLLLNILPKEIVRTLKNDQRTIADHFENASILFADIVNFTPLSSSMSPAQLVELLNDVFSKFDTLTEKYDLEKIKTIGDSYMVASGVPRARADHAQAITSMALEMRDFVSQNEFLGHKLEFRIGINSGPVIAGVIGHKKFSYDLWGDSVNIASRMESHGLKGAIQISKITYELIHNDFVCESHGTVQVKGKGEMDVWFVTGRRN